MNSNRMGSSPLMNLIQNTDKKETEKIPKTEKQPASSKTTKSQQASKPVVGETLPTSERKKATYYVRKDLIKGLKMLGAETEKDLSQLVEEAIEKLLKEKHLM
ncbi:MAG TPA: hypothetical protein PLS80_10370 [Cyclobacteriaceae bacterium]|nr:hypothetical protein [Cyclobacteriaceae bacterium]HNA14671.1 hypothetical protein [Cyclobacteriaceae bacterium]HNC30483.1 hypothetical protein [Cyclobacteriaceae bacterium]HND44342.1 hypothetical protein [Cyclobacteriaceae bacterium]HNH60423.1 hypothetical protein [Cyclobacteriaceae bacterium]